MGKKFKGRCNASIVKRFFSGGIYHFKHHLVGTRKDVEPCLAMPEDVKKEIFNILMRNVDVSTKKRKEMFDICDDDMPNEVEQPKLIGSGKDIMIAFVRKKISGARSTQTTINQMMKKVLREKACQQITRFFTQVQFLLIG